MGVILVYFVALSGSEAHDRFRVLIMPIVTQLAGLGWPPS
jgi:hypothetical protein